MQKAAQSSQPKSGNLGGGRVYAFRVSRVNADYVCLKLWLLGGVIRARNIAVAALPDLIAQIDAALADGCEVIALDGAGFSAPEKVLSGIKNEFSYCCTGVSDAKNVPSAGKAALPQSESLRSTKTKASAPQGSASAARQISGIKNEELRMKNELRRTSYSGARTRATVGAVISNEEPPASESASQNSPLCAEGGSDCTAPSASQVRPSCGAGVVADVSAIRADLDEMREAQEDFFENLAALLVRIAEVLNEERKTKNEELSTPADVVQRRDGAKGKNSSFSILNSSFPKTRRGRTSVVVGVRKVAKFQPKTKGKSK